MLPRYTKPLIMAVVMLLALMSADMARPTQGDDAGEVLAIQFAGTIAQDVLALDVASEMSFDLTGMFGAISEQHPVALSDSREDTQRDVGLTAITRTIRRPVPDGILNGRNQRNAPLKEPRMIRV